MPAELYGNVAETTLASSATSTDTTLTVTSSAGFPAASSAALTQFRAAFVDNTGAVAEYVTVTNVSGTTWTVVRESEDAARFAKAARASGHRIVHVVTADVITGWRAPPLTSGRYRLVNGSNSSSTGAHTLSQERCQTIDLPPGTALTTVAISVTTLAASTVVRLGVRADLDGRPDVLLADFGTIDVSTTGVKTLAISFTVPAGTGRLWLTATAQGSNAPTLAGRGSGYGIADTATASEAMSSPQVLYQSGVTGALPSTFTLAGVSSVATMIAVRAA